MKKDLAMAAASLAEQQLKRSAKRLLASRRQAAMDERATLSNLKVFVRVNGAGAASALSVGLGISRARMSELMNDKRGVTDVIAGKIAGMR